MTFIEVLDSAIKIGLGATIGGGFSWLLARTKNKHDIKVKGIDNRLEILKELSVKLEEIDILNAHTAFHFHNSEVDKSRECLIKSTEAANIGSAFSNMLGKDELVCEFASIVKVLECMYKELRSDECTENKLFALAEELQEHKKQVYPHIRSLYAELSS